MKRKIGILLCVFMLLCSVLLEGCGKEEQDSDPTEYYELSSVNKRLFDSKKKEDEKGMLLGMQFYQGEPIQLWSGPGGKVLLQKQGGSIETLLEGVEGAAAMQCYLDREGTLYCWTGRWSMLFNGEDAMSIWKLDASGAELFRVTLDPGTEFKNLCQLADGRMVMLLRDDGSRDWRLAELDPEKGKITKMDHIQLDRTYGTYYIAPGEQGLLVLNDGMSGGIYEIDLKDGKRIMDIPFTGTNYSVGANIEDMELRDLCVQEDGTVAMLWVNPDTGKGTQETLQSQKVEKALVVLRTSLLMDGGWLEERAREFNKSNDTYHVVVEYPDPSLQVEFKEMTSLEMSVGKGPDILYEHMLEGMSEWFRAGVIENLAPYMEDSGMLEEDYFPAAFSGYRDGDKIYTVRTHWRPTFTYIDKEVLGSSEEPGSIEELVDALLAWEGDEVYGNIPSSWILDDFLEGSEDFWGMLDWKKGSCDFSGELFAKMLEASKRYGYTWEEIYAGKYRDRPTIRGGVTCGFYVYDTFAEMEARGMVRSGTLFEDGCYATYSDHMGMYAISVNSRVKQGAWDFLCYLMSREVQRTIGDFDTDTPTNRAVFAELLEKELDKIAERLADGDEYCYYVPTYYQGQDGELTVVARTRKPEDMTPERIEEFISVLENSRDLTSHVARVQPIMNIIREEAEYYYNGEKSIEETVDIINNRVNLYMGEQK